ncbi:hypothetical protein [Streptomyces sp. NPDC056524]|uniref:DUF6197 family protein n=1 Tax=Streptomyces sp. NPDC056524 TaxID=3345851 RepID=UPI0036C3AB2E
MSSKTLPPATQHPHTDPRTAPSSAAPGRALPDTARLVEEALRSLRPDQPGVPPPPPDLPTWQQRIVPRTAQNLLAGWGMWQGPAPQPPSVHLLHTLGVLERYGWCKSAGTDTSGRMCIAGAQRLLQDTGHVTPAARARSVEHMHTVLAQAGVHMQFFAWNDLPGRTFPHVRALLTRTADHARQIGE